MEALKKKERQGETELTTKTGVPLHPPTLECKCFFFFFESHPSYDQTQGSSVLLSLLYR